MGYDILSVVELCGICALTFGVIGFVALAIAVRKARLEFRVKGYLRPPSGANWVPFLAGKHYDAFDTPETRFFFGISHFCLMALIIALLAVVLLLGCDQILKYLAESP